MGNGQSTTEEDDAFGYHVLHVMENSPAEKAGIEPFFDFIVGINETRLSDEDPEELMQHLVVNKGREVKLHVYSSKYDSVREIMLEPNDNWGGSIKSSLIGCSIRYCSYLSAAENVWHILDVAADSPASIAGLQSYTDYVVGAPRVTLTSLDDFFDLVERHNGQEMRLHVYNINWDSCREVMIVPNSKWGGQGSLGCNVGYGYLHRIPARNPRRLSVPLLQKPADEQEGLPAVTPNVAVSAQDGDYGAMEREPPQSAPAEFNQPVLKKKYAASKLSSISAPTTADEEGSHKTLYEVQSTPGPRAGEETTTTANQTVHSKHAELDELVHMSAPIGKAAERAPDLPTKPVSPTKSPAPVNTKMPAPDSPVATSGNPPELRGTTPSPSARAPSPTKPPSRSPSPTKSPQKPAPVQQRSPLTKAPPYGDVAELMERLSIEKSEKHGSE